METAPAQALSPQQAARMLSCSLCWQRPAMPCQRSPEGDHLARYLDAYRGGAITREAMAAVFEAAEVVTRWRIIPAAAS